MAEYQLKREAEPDFLPVVKLFTPDAGCTWLLTELDPEDPDIAFGLCDLGLGSPELGSVRISEIESVRGRLGLPVERDLYFKPIKTLSALRPVHATSTTGVVITVFRVRKFLARSYLITDKGRIPMNDTSQFRDPSNVVPSQKATCVWSVDWTLYGHLHDCKPQ